ncbi:hypothetical protein BaRGS_00021552 [Batillaria attramentaria]|uniref:Ig-like domain-containing protein n=1 Tax=Batillaria attramentaria TaxID=370345 RepID=A0ABD0KJ31_9CAEN
MGVQQIQHHTHSGLVRNHHSSKFMTECSGYHQTRAATVTLTSTLGVKGVSGHTITCQYGLAQGETFRSMNIYRGSGDVLIATMQSSDSAPLWTSDADSTLQGRATLSGSPGSPVTMEFSDTLCSDNGEVYKCEVSYVTSSVVSQVEDTTTVRVEAPPQRPQPMAITPQVGNNVTEFTVLTFSCTGNVGLPAGTFQWFTYFGENPVNVTDQATQGTARPEDCTFSRNSTLRYTTTRTQVGEDLVVRCRVYHPTQGSNNDPMDCGTSNTFCSMSQKISVQYPVNVSVAPPMLTVTEGESATLTCTADGNPAATEFKWYQGDMDNVLSNTTELRLEDLTLNQTGNYTCISYNTVSGVKYSSSATTDLTVSEKPPPTTTPEPTTPAPTTTPEAGGTDGSTSKAGTDGRSRCAAFLVYSIVVFVQILDAGQGNHAGINTLATRPDLVNNDKIYPAAYNNAGGFKNEDGLTYAELQFDNKPRSRRPLALDDTHTDYSDVSMPQV